MKNSENISGKRIAVISHSAGGGGAERVATLLANYLSNKGNEVFFYAVHSDKREYFLEDKVKYCFNDVTGKNKILKQIKRAYLLKKFILNNKIDTMVALINLEGFLLIGNKKVRKIYSLRNDPNTFYNSGVMKWLRNKIYEDADKVVFQTPDARDYFGDKVKEHSLLIPNPIKENLPFWDVDNHKKEVITVCRISKQKNLKMLIDAFYDFSKECRDYKLKIYGDGDLREELEDYVASLEIQDKVDFMGFSNNVHEAVTKAEMFVLSSDYEGISNAMLEALAIGIPTICTDCPVGGARMFIESGGNGFLVPVKDTKCLSERMIELAKNEELKQKFFSEAPKIRNKLKTENICGEWTSII